MKKLLTYLLICLYALSITSYAQQKKATDLPNISVIGSFLGTHTDEKDDFSVNEIELSFQHMLYPSVKADIFMALHKEGDNKLELALEEAYVTFIDLAGVIAPNMASNLGIGAILGKKMVNFGKLNPLHPEQRKFIDRPLATQQVLGGHESLSGEGAQLAYLLPLPFFSQIELGYWKVAKHEEEESSQTEEAHGVEYEKELLNTRLWNSMAISEQQEIELGLSFLLGNASAESKKEQQELIGLDLSYTHELGVNQKLSLQGEYYNALYGEEDEPNEGRKRQIGGFVSAFYSFNASYEAGLRYGTLGKHGDEGQSKTQWSLIAVKQLTDTSKFRLQYNTGDQVEDTAYLQFIFGMGPHSHVLQ
ncbi:MAG: hypothetical protein VW378_02500 [bacterium]